ncbi:hypothetical protein ABW19_dt0208696 [Dactylella cylindrospora]|nr:hypothetical protein ABW19_dt0208696 [Dactylella cylindrospora]
MRVRKLDRLALTFQCHSTSGERKESVRTSAIAKRISIWRTLRLVVPAVTIEPSKTSSGSKRATLSCTIGYVLHPGPSSRILPPNSQTRPPTKANQTKTGAASASAFSCWISPTSGCRPPRLLGGVFCPLWCPLENN